MARMEELSRTATDALAANATERCVSLKYPNDGIKALAAYAAQQLLLAEDHKERKDWFDRLLSTAKTAEKSAPSTRVQNRREALALPTVSVRSRK
tara:strand:+ start:665 stop:949 length:285 start_codon:yes stop_codon:yes gene_type:complete